MRIFIVCPLILHIAPSYVPNLPFNPFILKALVMSDHQVEPMSHLRSAVYRSAGWHGSPPWKSKHGADFHHITACPPLRSYPHEVYEPWNMHLAIRWCSLFCDMTKLKNICTSWIPARSASIPCGRTPVVFDWTCIMVNFIKKSYG